MTSPENTPQPPTDGETDDKFLATVDEPSPPRPPLTGTESVKLIGGLVVVCTGLLVLLVIAVVGMLLVKKTTSDVVAVATSPFGVIGTVVGAYFGLKIGTDGTQSAVAGMKDEASKAQAFAAHVPRESAAAAIGDAKALTAGGAAAPRMPSTGERRPGG